MTGGGAGANGGGGPGLLLPGTPLRGKGGAGGAGWRGLRKQAQRLGSDLLHGLGGGQGKGAKAGKGGRPAAAAVLAAAAALLLLLLLLAAAAGRGRARAGRGGGTGGGAPSRESIIRELIGVDKEYHGLEARHSALAMERHKLVRELEVAEHEAGIDDLVEEERGESIPTAHLDFGSWADRTPDPGPRRPTVLTGKLDRVKIYVYDLPSKFNKDMVKRYRRCASDQYGTEVFFHEALTRHGNEFRTMKPEEADFFFVPIYGECFLWQHEMLRGDGHEKSFKLTNDFFNEALDLVKAKGFWDKSGGRDHVFVFPGARGPTIFSDWRSKIRMSIYLTPEGDRKASYFNTWKDIVIPGMEFDPQFYTESSRNELITSYGKDRQFLSFFRGTIDHRDGASYSRGLRPRLKKILANEKDVIYDKKRKDCDRRCYRKEMAQSKFCLNPLGWTPWTLRFYQALMTRCIPVMIADDIEFPFENEIDYTEFALKIPEKDVDNIVALMRGMSDEELERRRDVMDRIWKKYTYQRPPQPGDAFYSTMEELARKRKRHRDAPGRLLP